MSKKKRNKNLQYIALVSFSEQEKLNYFLPGIEEQIQILDDNINIL